MKKYIYIATFTLAGEVLFGFVSLLIALVVLNLSARGFLNHSMKTCVDVVSAIAFLLMIVGGLLGYRGGVYFWPKLYRADGSLRFKNWKGFRARLRHTESDDSVGEYEKQ